jgi:hypothetical protein
VSDQKRPVDRLLDVVLYAPLGFVMNLEEVIPQLVEKGHQQVNMARMFGQFAVKAGSEEARKRVDQVSGQVGDLVNRRPPVERPATPSPVSVADAAPTSEPPASTDPVPDAGSLGITDYDALSASQVVPRLAGLLASELDAVRLYELANRGRKTILSKIAQLQG